MPQKNRGFSSSISFSNGSCLTDLWGAASSARSDNGYAFSPGDLVRVCHPNVNNKKHRDKTGTIQDRMSRGDKVWIKFSDDSTGAVDLIALVPIDTIHTSVKTIDVEIRLIDQLEITIESDIASICLGDATRSRL